MSPDAPPQTSLAPFGLFERYGVELEYMIVDRETLAVRPFADRLLVDDAGRPTGAVERGPITWSNELAGHVIELKLTEPAPALDGLCRLFHGEIRHINRRLASWNAMLLPTGAHPWMDPYTEARLWPHEGGEVYAVYDRIFDCRGHGWVNLQSAHLNLPFRGDAEFGRLHAAVRVLLPILPALSAGTPILEGRLTGFADARLEVYRHNQDRIPSITGQVIPEAVFTEADYDARIFAPIRRDVRPYDADGVLEHHFLNSRGAIARFDRGAIEIRVLDLQECPAADLAILELIVSTLKALVAERWASWGEQQAWSEHDLAALFLDMVRTAEQTPITNPDYLHLFGLRRPRATAAEVWTHLLGELGTAVAGPVHAVLVRILRQGSLATRIARSLGAAPAPDVLRRVYARLGTCLQANTLFVP